MDMLNQTNKEAEVLVEELTPPQVPLDETTETVKEETKPSKVKKEKTKPAKVKKEKTVKVKKEKVAKEKVVKEKVKKEKVKPAKVKKEKAGKPKSDGKLGKLWNKLLPVLADLTSSRKIRTTIVGGFLVLVVFIIILGVASYQKASGTVVDSYKDSSLNTISAESMYFGLLCETISSKTAELVKDSNTSKYYEMYYDQTDADTMNMFMAVKNSLKDVKNSADYINSYFIVSSRGQQISSEDTALPADAYNQLYASDTDGVYLSQNVKQNRWLGRHAYIDSVYGNDDSAYGLVFYQRFMKTDAVLVMDVSMDTIEEALAGMDFGKGSYKAIVTQDGREIIYQNIIKDGNSVQQPVDKNLFVGKKFYEESVEEKAVGSKEVRVDGKKYLYVYAPVGKTGIMTCGLIPYSNITAEANSIRNITIILVLLSVVVALFVGNSIARRITKELTYTVDSLDHVAKGDLTVDFQTKRKDEFLMLSDGINRTLSGIRGLMSDVQGFGSEVNELSGGLVKTSDTIDTSMKEIATAVDKVAHGVVTQAGEADTCNDIMAKFAERIEKVCDHTQDMGGVADKAIDAVTKGKVIIEDLNGQSDATVALAKGLEQDIQNVKKQSDQIENIIDVINEIAEQTNLLSLNASIEAARAGENGRGFAVVADEIRKLADQSMQAGNQIKDIVGNIQSTTNQTTQSAQKTEEFINKLATSLDDTIVVFADINKCVNELVSGLQFMAARMVEIGEEKNSVESAIGNISAISEETAAAAEEITATLNEQVMSISYLNEKAEQLATQVHALEEASSQFRV